MKWVSHVDGEPINSLNEDKKNTFQKSAIDRIASFGFKIHTITAPEERVKNNDCIYGSNNR